MQLICVKHCSRTWEYEDKDKQDTIPILKDLAVQGERPPWKHGNDRLESVVIRSAHCTKEASAFSVRNERPVLRVIQSSGSQTSVGTRITTECWIPPPELLVQ